MTEQFLLERAQYSQQRLDTLRETVASRMTDVSLAGLSIFAAGSFARHEAGQHSDVDLFFTYHPSGTAIESRRTNEYKLFAHLIEIIEELKFPAFSNDGEFLRTHDIAEILRNLGGPVDDAENYFTLRMLMILESKCVFGEASYISALTDVIESYYRDFAGNENTFQPWFLINDIMRYWKTLLLNYENRRNFGGDVEEKAKWRVKNFKLRYSRMLTCFATIAALASHRSPANQNDILQMALSTPQERLASVVENRPGTQAQVLEILDEYSWFLEQTSLTKSELYAQFASDGRKEALSSRAELFGGMMYDLLAQIDADRNYEPPLIRYLVI